MSGWPGRGRRWLAPSSGPRSSGQRTGASACEDRAYGGADNRHGPALVATCGWVPLLNLNLRLGERTVAAMSMHLIDDACAELVEMTTFADAGISGRGQPAEAAPASASNN